MRRATGILSRATSVALFVVCFAAQAQVAARDMVAAAHPLAVQAGQAMLERGGSAVDAAIAVQLVLGLVEPESSGIGGGAFLLHWSDKEKKLRTYDGREAAPAAARADRFMKNGKPMAFYEAAIGGRSVGVPGVLRMLELAHRRHGRLPWADLFEPAIRLAEQGFAVSPRLHETLDHEPYLKAGAEAAKLYYPGGKTVAIGAILLNSPYGETLRRIAREGTAAFYEGDLAATMVQAVRGNARPGDLTLEDIAGYRAQEREPVCAPYRQWKLCSMGPPSSGGIAVLQLLGILERTPFARAAPQSVEAVHLFAEAGRLAFADRARYVGDPAFTRIPIASLLSSSYLQKRAKLIGERSMRVATPGDTEAAGTSHVSIVEANGDAVALTTTIEAAFGSRIMARGFHLNNELTDFDFTPGTPNEVGPGKRPRSSMAPMMVFDAEGRLHMVLGSPGGSMIINYVAKTLVAALDWKMDVQAAAAAPNFGSRNGPTYLERGTAYEKLKDGLSQRNHPVEIVPLVSGVHAIERVPGGWRGGADPRREGIAAGR